jgi:histidine triad (HIT) family protein
MENCIFCKIIKGEIPSYNVWEDDKAFAFLNIMPHKSGHLLLIPKKHEDYFFDLDDETIKDLVVKAKPLAQALKKVYQPATGKVSLVLMGMGVAHVHLHLFPLDKESDINTDKAYKATPDELTKNMEKIKGALRS